MSVEENRTCPCQMNMYNNSNNDNDIENMSCECKRMQRKELAEKIKALNFAVIELALYLDTHPEDEKALCLHRKYAKELRELEDIYQKMYGSLSIKFPCNKWRWLEAPWAWFDLE